MPPHNINPGPKSHTPESVILNLVGMYSAGGPLDPKPETLDRQVLCRGVYHAGRLSWKLYADNRQRDSARVPGTIRLCFLRGVGDRTRARHDRIPNPIQFHEKRCDLLCFHQHRPLRENADGSSGR